MRGGVRWCKTSGCVALWTSRNPRNMNQDSCLGVRFVYPGKFPASAVNTCRGTGRLSRTGVWTLPGVKPRHCHVKSARVRKWRASVYWRRLECGGKRVGRATGEGKRGRSAGRIARPGSQLLLEITVFSWNAYCGLRVDELSRSIAWN